MIIPKLPSNESERLSELKKYNLLDTLPEEDFDNITNLVAAICEVPISLISLLDTDRNFLKSHHGVPINEAPRDASFCGHTIVNDDEIFIVEDAREDERFVDNPSIKEFDTIFYAGVRLVNPNGFPLGVLCVYDTKPRKLSDTQRMALLALSKQVVNLFELRKKNEQLKNFQTELEQRNERLNSFANVVSHDLKSPLANITSLTRLIRDENASSLKEDSLQYLDYIEESSTTLKNYINGILKFYKTEALIDQKRRDVPIKELLDEIKEILILNNDEFCYPNTGTLKNINKAALTQIILNLVDNGFKYNLNEKCTITIEFEDGLDFYTFKIIDNGIGIEKDKQEEIFSLFTTGGIKDRSGNEGTGIGLATVKSLVYKLGGEIWLSSEIGKGTTFTFTIKK